MSGRNDHVSGIWDPTKKRFDKVSGIWDPVKKRYDRVNGIWVPSYKSAPDWTTKLKSGGTSTVSAGANNTIYYDLSADDDAHAEAIFHFLESVTITRIHGSAIINNVNPTYAQLEFEYSTDYSETTGWTPHLVGTQGSNPSVSETVNFDFANLSITLQADQSNVLVIEGESFKVPGYGPQGQITATVILTLSDGTDFQIFIN